MPYVHHITAGILILAGSYIVYYWLFKGDLISTLIQAPRIPPPTFSCTAIIGLN